MIARLVSFALSQRFLIVIGSLMLMVWGALSFRNLPIDAYPDLSPPELKTIQDWVLERAYRAIQGVADDSGFGGTTMQYQVLLDPNKLFAYGVSVPQISDRLSNNNANAGGGFYSQGG